MNRTIEHTFFYPHPVEKVWDYLTKPELIAMWLMENDFQPIVGHKFQFKAKPIFKLKFDGNIFCEVLEVVPHERLTYSWKGGTDPENPRLNSIVTWTLTTKDNGTELKLEHKGFEGMKNYAAYLIMGKGWQKIAKRFLTMLNEQNHGSSIA